jgi:hypothetical protein
MKYINPEFGYNIVCVGQDVFVYTGKIRVKAKMNELTDGPICSFVEARFCNSKNNCVIVSFATTNSETFEELIQATNKTIANIMHRRIDAKYAKKEYDLETSSYLPVESIDLRKKVNYLETLSELID